MAIYHMSVQLVKRSAGRSSVAASAYRSGVRLVDERTGEVHDYTRKGAIGPVGIELPEGAPSRLSDRGTLWNAAEAAEGRRDAQVAREINVAIPKELDPERATALARGYARSFAAQGMCADWAIHHLRGENPHMHVMLTTRDVSPDGFGAKNRGWNDRAKVEEWRLTWESMANDALASAGSAERVDRRSLEAQGVDREPTHHLGYRAAAMERRGIRTAIGDENRAATALSEDLARATAERRAVEAELVDLGELPAPEEPKPAQAPAKGTKPRERPAERHLSAEAEQAKKSYLAYLERTYEAYRSKARDAAKGKGHADIGKLRFKRPPKEIDGDFDVDRKMLSCWRSAENMRNELMGVSVQPVLSGRASGGSGGESAQRRGYSHTEHRGYEQSR